MNIYELFFRLGEVVEVRVIGAQGKNAAWEGFARQIVSGYFDNPASFAKAIAALEKLQVRGIFFTLNPVNPALLARAANRLKVPTCTTQDVDITCVRWLPIDLDPRRPAGISSTEEELHAALNLGKEIATWLENEIGFAHGLRAASGNGCHLLFRLADLPNTADTHKLIVDAMAVIKSKFDSDRVEIDSAVVNPARLWKVYGTFARKGDDVPTRPHRVSGLFPNQPLTLAEVPICL